MKPGASNPAATSATPGVIAASTPQASPDSHTTDRSPPPAAAPVGAGFRDFAAFDAFAIRSAHRRQDQRGRDRRETDSSRDLLSQSRRQGATA